MADPKVPKEFEARGLAVDAVDETGAPWAFEADYDDDSATWWTVLTDGWLLGAVWEYADGVVRLRELREVPCRSVMPPGAADGTTKMIARLRLGSVYYNVRRLFRWHALGVMLPDEWLRAIERGDLDVPRRGRPSELRTHAEWAAKYVDALQRDPRSPVALLVREHPNDTAEAIRSRLTRARRLKLLTAAPAGQPGGELTSKAKKILEADNG